jgi:hypothetical protein
LHPVVETWCHAVNTQKWVLDKGRFRPFSSLD